ncbi:MAG: glycosyltransferase, partial [Sphaerospermopsis sp. SIO1G2]|nr:glycosyltransferase [Sphaerospermopsis sp. SIO1G2]
QAAHLLHRMIDTGWVSEDSLPNLLACADAGIYLMEDDLLNRTKCPVKLADMLHVGVPVVGERVGQVAEYIISGETGLLRPSGDHTGLVTDLVQLLSDGALRGRFAAQAQQHIQQNFSWDTHAATLDGYYRGYCHRDKTDNTAVSAL